ncbi:MAG: DUF2231 domain-containing protein [Phenylobacterium sp.]|nr:DUF2231 domain-containing protein [Phenylobacterium sp.]
MTYADRAAPPGLHPLHAILLAFPVALFASALASDIAYLRTAVIQWTNFSSWLITGALLLGAPVVAWAAIGAVFPRGRARGPALAYLVLVAVMWIAGLVNAFQHSRDGWSSVGTFGLILSIISTIAALAAAWIAHATVREDVR